MDARRLGTDPAVPELRYMQTRQFAAYIGRTPKAVERMRERGGGPPWFYVCSTPTYDKIEVDRYFSEQLRLQRTSRTVAP